MEQTWIEEQKKNRLFRGGGTSGDAYEMLKHSPTNRYLGKTQAKRITAARFIGIAYGIPALVVLADMVEQAQMCVDGQSRRDYMKVAIEQWQGKIAATKARAVVENLV